MITAPAMSFKTSFLFKVWENFKRLLDISWIMTYAINGDIVLLLIILLKCFLQHVVWQRSINKSTLQVLMALKHPEHGPLQEVICAWLSKI